MKKTSIIFCLLFCSIAHAEFQNCGGIVTNKACSDLNKKNNSTNQKMESKTNSNETNPKKNSKKDSLIHELKMLTIKAKRKYELSYDTEILEQECKSNSLAQCDKIVKEANKELHGMINSAKITKLKEAELKNVSKDKDKNKTTVVIQNNNVIIPRVRRSFRSLKSDQNSSSPTNVK